MDTKDKIVLLGQIYQTELQQAEHNFKLEGEKDKTVEADINKMITHNVETVDLWKRENDIDPNSKELAEDKVKILADMLKEATEKRDFYQRQIDKIKEL